ncbi:MAG: hypothetical protein CMH46_00730 [Muricauda sp.]|jgi:hypothetical protein|nr:hypothetical protein [Allomuricauda sp.]
MVDLDNYLLFRDGLHYFDDEENDINANVEAVQLDLLRDEDDGVLTYNEVYGNSRAARAQRMRNGIVPVTSNGLPVDNNWNFYVHREDLAEANATGQAVVRVRTQRFNSRYRGTQQEFRGYTTIADIAGVPEGVQHYYVHVENRRVVDCTCPDKLVRELPGPGCKHQRLVRMLLTRRVRRTQQQRMLRRLRTSFRVPFGTRSRRLRRRRRR